MKRRGLPLLCLLLAAGFVALGVWQVERRAWKLDLIARVDARVHAAPAPLPTRAAWSRVNARDDAYCRVRARGVFAHERATLVQAVTDLGPGWWVVTPLRTRDDVVLVNRGFVPPERTATVGRPAGEVTVTGLLRLSEPGGGFLRRNDPGANRWYSRDTAAIGRARGLADVAPFFIDADATPNSGGYPVGGLTVVSFPNNHLTYAITWFALAGLAGYGTIVALRREAA